MSPTETKPTHPYLQYGGQAVIEGVMMRSPHYFAVACRKPDGGIIVQEEPVDRSIVGKFQWMNRPLLRGTLALIDAMALGMKALNFAASVQTQGMAEKDASGDAAGAALPATDEAPATSAGPAGETSPLHTDTCSGGQPGVAHASRVHDGRPADPGGQPCRPADPGGQPCRPADPGGQPCRPADSAGLGGASAAPTGRRADSVASASRERPSSRINDIAVGATMVTAICFGVALFVALPTGLTQWVQGLIGIPRGVALPHRQQILLNLVDGLIRITIFLGYIALISRMENIRRVFQYHGAEHKAINTLEAGETLTPENCLRASRIHPRCGTSFIIVVLLASILVHSLLPRPEFYLTRLALHIGLIPIVAGLAYEVIKLAGRFRESIITRTLLAPGLWSQRLTTREPALEHVEVALAALQAVVAAEQARDQARERGDTPTEAAAAASSAVA